MAIKPYLQLVRLPNVFTAGADSLAGWLLVTGTFSRPRPLAPAGARLGVYLRGGIVLNDVFDFELDRVERPERPLPTGQIGRRFAAWLGAFLLAAGLALAVGSGTTYGGAVEIALIGCVLAYDAGLKRSPLGPEVMGACRGLNLLLGLSQADRLGKPAAWLRHVLRALCDGDHLDQPFGSDRGPRKNIAVGLTFQNVAFFGLIVACAQAPTFPDPGAALAGTSAGGCAALATLGFVVQSRTIRALRTPEPELVRRAVKFGIMSLVWVHVFLILGVRGILPGVAFAVFWIPAAYVGRWIYST